MRKPTTWIGDIEKLLKTAFNSNQVVNQVYIKLFQRLINMAIGCISRSVYVYGLIVLFHNYPS